MLMPFQLPALGPAFRLLVATSWLAPENRQQHQRDSVLAASEEGIDWNSYLRLVDRHRTPVLSCAALRRVPEVRVPAATLEALAHRSRQARVQSLVFARLLASVLESFAGAGIPVMPLKGVVLSRSLYGDPGLRQAKDLDLMVPPEAFPEAQRVLTHSGWILTDPAPTLTPRQWQAFVRQEHHVVFQHGETRLPLELHWAEDGESPAEVSRLWRNSSQAQWEGQPYRCMDPVDQVLALCAHGGRHAWARAKWLGDLARIHALGQVDWTEALAAARRADKVPVLLQTLALLERLYGLPLPPLGDPCWEGWPQILLEHPWRSLLTPVEPWERGSLELVQDRLMTFRYQAALQPRRSLRERIRGLGYCRQDFRFLPLPDWLFWAYLPLRPALWVLRRLFDPARPGAGGHAPGGHGSMVCRLDPPLPLRSLPGGCPNRLRKAVMKWFTWE